MKGMEYPPRNPDNVPMDLRSHDGWAKKEVKMHAPPTYSVVPHTTHSLTPIIAQRQQNASAYTQGLHVICSDIIGVKIHPTNCKYCRKTNTIPSSSILKMIGSGAVNPLEEEAEAVCHEVFHDPHYKIQQQVFVLQKFYFHLQKRVTKQKSMDEARARIASGKGTPADVYAIPGGVISIGTFIKFEK